MQVVQERGKGLLMVLALISLLVLLAVGCAQGSEVVPPPTTTTATSSMPAVAAGCNEGDTAPLGVLRSTDHGATWTSLGNACMEGSTVWAVDPTPLTIEGGIALYFLDLHTLTGDDSTATQRIIYRATTSDGVSFTTPQPAYAHNRDIVDPFVLQMPDGSYRMYIPTDGEGVASAVSPDGLVFTREPGVRAPGGMPGALLLPDGRVRLFLSGLGIDSSISDDGLSFTQESGQRVPATAETIVDNPQPIRLRDGSYLMLFSIHDRKWDTEGPGTPWTYTEIRLATSSDGLDWTVNPSIIGYGGTSCVVEAGDGTLFIYYVNA